MPGGNFSIFWWICVTMCPLQGGRNKKNLKNGSTFRPLNYVDIVPPGTMCVAAMCVCEFTSEWIVLVRTLPNSAKGYRCSSRTHTTRGHYKNAIDARCRLHSRPTHVDEGWSRRSLLEEYIFKKNWLTFSALTRIIASYSRMYCETINSALVDG